MTVISVQRVTKTFGGHDALTDLSVTFDDGGFYALLGPSGSGKTTLLRLIAGFEFPDAGRILFNGDPVEMLPAEKRDVGMMFQSYALFPNMSVFDNVAFGLSVRKVPAAEIRTRVGEALELVRLTGYDRRKPSELSGGQRQRVALARAIVFRPRVLLLDEPLSALDKALRLGMQVELRRIQRDVGITTLFVTHDQEEALTLADRVGVLRDGRLVQEGPPRQLYERPATAFTATFLGDANLLRGPTTAGVLTLADGTSLVPDSPASGAEAICAVRPERIDLLAPGEDAAGRNVITGTVSEVIFAGNALHYLVDWQGQSLKVTSPNRGTQAAAPGESVRLGFARRDTVLVAP
ncbi:ABC transporter ATP-binding protein [Paroceanicella profunda]|uniref:ABC transporter ATP-binding protein n=1 Tax=Paroceanicella profunda TaxID=2579971 RepID=A0A5B8G2H6_9RHOB|nr:ABC transporter ATP-binding protein [Paroceanicella profunda]QDL93362.1 ABC transporter ATP-binding protein [Paroceanicella profunda]